MLIVVTGRLVAIEGTRLEMGDPVEGAMRILESPDPLEIKIEGDALGNAVAAGILAFLARPGSSLLLGGSRLGNPVALGLRPWIIRALRCIERGDPVCQRVFSSKKTYYKKMAILRRLDLVEVEALHAGKGRPRHSFRPSLLGWLLLRAE